MNTPNSDELELDFCVHKWGNDSKAICHILGPIHLKWATNGYVNHPINIMDHDGIMWNAFLAGVTSYIREYNYAVKAAKKGG